MGFMFMIGFLAGVGITMGMYVLCMDHIKTRSSR